jgi:hypothetical protein
MKTPSQYHDSYLIAGIAWLAWLICMIVALVIK